MPKKDVRKLSLIVSLQNFWVPGNYKLVLKRLKIGYNMIGKLMSYMQGRVRAEMPSDKLIRQWLGKWEKGLSKNPAYEGLLIHVFELINDASAERIRLSSGMRSVVIDVILPKLKAYQSYAKEKGLKNLGKEFRRVQKPWAKAMKKVQTIKVIYHEACRACLETATLLQSNTISSGHGVVPMSPEVREKTQVRHEEYVVEVERCRTVYEANLYELNIYKNQYIEGMLAAFQKCIDIERERLSCFQECMHLFVKATSCGKQTTMTEIWDNVDRAIASYSVDDDLKYFTATVGPDMPYDWPAFEEWENRPSQRYDD